MIRLRWRKVHSTLHNVDRWEARFDFIVVNLFTSDGRVLVNNRRNNATYYKFKSFTEAAPVIKKLLGESNEQT